ncbi:hypothetical protein M2149_001840 [Lachnospiraceae bacterium PFB1-21]
MSQAFLFNIKVRIAGEYYRQKTKKQRIKLEILPIMVNEH